ncbi:hypothetical protein KI387_030170, partial [Taxus chinensis]
SLSSEQRITKKLQSRRLRQFLSNTRKPECRSRTFVRTSFVILRLPQEDKDGFKFLRFHIEVYANPGHALKITKMTFELEMDLKKHSC